MHLSSRVSCLLVCEVPRCELRFDGSRRSFDLRSLNRKLHNNNVSALGERAPVLSGTPPRRSHLLPPHLLPPHLLPQYVWVRCHALAAREPHDIVRSRVARDHGAPLPWPVTCHTH